MSPLKLEKLHPYGAFKVLPHQLLIEPDTLSMLKNLQELYNKRNP